MNTSENASSLKQQERLHFIEFCLYWHGDINRNDLINRFQVSPAQATLDLKAYQEAAPENVQYNVSTKRYIPSSSFSPVLIQPNATDYLSTLLHTSAATKTNHFGFFPGTETLPPIYRKIKPETLQSIVHSMKYGHSVHIRHQSPYSPDSTLRPIYPKVFVFALGRWHLRAYCLLRKDFRSFTLGRILSVGSAETLTESIPTDTNWDAIVKVSIKPSDTLCPEGQKIIASEYNMKKGVAKIPVRRALLKYFLFENRFSRNQQAEPSLKINLAVDNGMIALAKPDVIQTELQTLYDTRNS